MSTNAEAAAREADGERSALVTGATGFIGGHLVRALLDGGWRVRAFGRRSRPESLPDEIDYRVADLVGDDPLEPLFEGVTHVFHLAGASSSTSTEEEMYRINVSGTENLVSAAHAAGVQRLVHMSTSSVYGKEVDLPQPVPEDVEPHPSPGYGESKWQAEQAAWRFAEKGLPVVVLRPATVYGPGAIKLMASTILDAAIERFAGLEAFAVPQQPAELRMVHVDDVAAACLHLATHEATVGRAFNLVSGLYPSSHEVAEVVADELGLDLQLSDEAEPGLSYDERAAAHERMLEAGMADQILLKEERIRFLKKSNPNNRLSMDALESTGFRPGVTDLDSSVRSHIAWCRDHRWIV